MPSLGAILHALIAPRVGMTVAAHRDGAAAALVRSW